MARGHHALSDPRCLRRASGKPLLRVFCSTCASRVLSSKSSTGADLRAPWRCVWCEGVFRALKTPERASYFADASASAHILHYDCRNAAEVLHFDCMRERRP